MSPPAAPTSSPRLPSLNKCNMDQKEASTPHVLMFPLPLPSPVNCMLKLAELFCVAGLQVTVLNTEVNYRRLLRHSNAQSRFYRYPGFRFETTPDGLPEDHPRTIDRVGELFDSLESAAKPVLRKLLNCPGQPVTCVVADASVSFALGVAEEKGIPFFCFDPISPACLWVFLCTQRLVEAGELPFKNGNDMDKLIMNVPGMEGVLRKRDLPGIFRNPDLSHPDFQAAKMRSQLIPRAHGLIVNTFQQLEAPILSQIRSHCQNLYAIAPLHTHLKSRLASSCSNNSFWEEDRTCIKWLDCQPHKSVIYASFGSLTLLSEEELMEFWHGLVNSEVRFLWVIRPDSINESNSRKQDIIRILKEGAGEKGCIVEWAPQEEVLAHPAIGGYLNHGGWVSVLESIAEGVPMICWAFQYDQQVISRFVEKVWKLGLDMKDTCDRRILERMIKDVMDQTRAEEFKQRADEMSEMATATVKDGGSSYGDFDRLIEDIRILSN